MHCRWLVSTALGLTLAAASAYAFNDELPAYQQILWQNQQAAESVGAPLTIARADGVAPTSPGEGILRSGRILLQRTEVAVPPPTPEQLEAKLKRVAEAAVAARKTDILTDVEARLNQRTTELAMATQQELQTTEARARQYAEEARNQAIATAQQVADEKTNATEARLASLTEAELQVVRAETARKLAEQQQNTATRLTILEATTKAGHDVTLAQLGATEARLKAATDVQSAQSMAKLEALTAAATAQWQATQDQLASLQLQTASALTDVRTRQQEVASQTREYARLQAMAAQLEAQKSALTQAQIQATQAEARAKQFAVEQMAARDTELQAHLGQLAATTSAKLDSVREVTSAKLSELDTKSQARDEALAQATSAKLDAVRDVTAAKLSEVDGKNQARTEALAQTTSTKLAALQDVTLAKLEQAEAVSAVQYQALLAKADAGDRLAAEQLKAARTEYAEKLGALREATLAKLAEVDGKNQIRTAALEQTTAARLSEIKNTTLAKLDENQAVSTSRFKELQTKAEAGDKVAAARIDALREASILHNQYSSQMQAERLNALKQATETKLDALKQATVASLDATRQIQSAKLDAVAQTTQQQFAASAMLAEMRQQQTDTKLDDLTQLTRENRELAQAETRRVAEYLQSYGDMQVARLAADTSATIASVAKHNRLNLIEIGEATNARLAALREEAQTRSNLLAQTFANTLQARIAEAQKVAEAKALKPEQVRSIASKTVEEATPQIKALAMQTLADSQNYIKTVARSAVKDGDPALKQALADAARNVIEKDGKVAFAIRQVVNDQLKQVAYAPLASGTLPFGPGERPDIITSKNADGTDVAINGAGLGVAAIEPAAGGAVSGQQVAMGNAKLTMASREPSMMRARQRADWVELRKYRVVVHEDAKSLEELLGNVVRKAEPYTGPWQIKWKISPENKDVLDEKFSLDAETTFEEFVNYLAQYMANERGIKLSFSMFDAERIMVVSD